MIVAWHKVPGTAPPQKIRPVGYGMIRAGVRTDSKIGGGKSRMRYRLAESKWSLNPFQEEYLAFLKNRDAYFDEKYLWDQLRPIIPYPTGRFFGRDAFPGTSCQARIMPSLRDKSHSPIEGPRLKLAPRGFYAFMALQAEYPFTFEKYLIFSEIILSTIFGQARKPAYLACKSRF
jgi:hypothetical protein